MGRISPIQNGKKCEKVHFPLNFRTSEKKKRNGRQFKNLCIFFSFKMVLYRSAPGTENSPTNAQVLSISSKMWSRCITIPTKFMTVFFSQKFSISRLGSGIICTWNTILGDFIYLRVSFIFFGCCTGELPSTSV